MTRWIIASLFSIPGHLYAIIYTYFKRKTFLKPIIFAIFAEILVFKERIYIDNN
jgi:hypothetical protein